MCVNTAALLTTGATTVLTPTQQLLAAGDSALLLGQIGAARDIGLGVAGYRSARAEAAAQLAYGETKAKRIRQAGEAELGATRSAAVASGVSLSSGSVLDAERSVVRNVEQDALTAILGGRLKADAARRGGMLDLARGFGSAAGSLVDGYGKWKAVRKAAGEY